MNKTYSAEYIARQRAIAKVWILGYKTSKKQHPNGHYRRDTDRITALAKISYAKRVAGKHITSRDYEYEQTKAAEIGRRSAKAQKKWEAAQ